MEISDMIKLLCRKNGITVAELARRIGQSSQNLTQKIKRGTVSMDEMTQIAAAVGADYDQCFSIPGKGKIRLKSTEEGSQMTIDEINSGLNTDAMLIPKLFLALYHIDLDEDMATVIYRDKWLDEKYGNTGKISGLFNTWVNEDVHPGDRDEMINRLSVDEIRNRLHNSPKFSTMYRSIHGGNEKYRELMIIQALPDTDRFIYACFIDRNVDMREQIEKEQMTQKIEFSRSVFLSAVQSIYQKCFLCDLNDNVYRQVREGMDTNDMSVSDGEYDEFIGKISLKLSDSSQAYEFKQQLSRNYLLAMFYGGTSSVQNSFIFRNEEGAEKCYNIRILLKKDLKDNVIAVFLVSDNTEDYEKERKIGQLSREDKNNYEIINAFTKQFVSVYNVDLDNDRYEILKMNERSVMASVNFTPKGESYWENTKDWIEHFVHPEDRGALLSVLSIDNLKRISNNEAGAVAIYRDIVFGEPEYFEVHVLKHDSYDMSNKVLVVFNNADVKIKEQMERQESMKKALLDANAAVEAKRKFLFNLSHDIRTPMNAIIGFAQIAMLNSNISPKIKDCIEKIQASSESLLHILNDVLEMSNLESGGIELNESSVDSMSLGKDIVAMIQQAAFKKNIKFSYIVKDVVSEEVICDINRVNQILLNLLTNAVNFTEEGGSVTFSVEQQDSGKEGIRRFCFSVKDSGVGISSDMLSYIFEPFAKEKSSTESGVEGTGLGLSIAKRLADMMGGRIEAESVKEIGSVFRFIVDFRQKDSGNTQDYKKMKKNGDVPRRVLIADDDRLNLEVMKKMLAEIGIEADIAQNGQIAVDMLCKSEKKYYSAVFMDIEMPVMDGFETTETIRKLFDKSLAQIPIVAVTATDASSNIRRCFDAGMDDFITKPINMELLKSVINHIWMRG